MSVIAVEQQKQIEGVMRGLMMELEKLAPHPDRSTHKGPLFVKIDAHLKPPAEYDGMLGSMMLESFLGTAFAEAGSAQSTGGFGRWTQTFSHIDWSNAADVADAGSHYIEDRSANQNYKIGQRGSISGSFNKSVAWEHLMKAYLRDLPKRLGLERWLSDYQRTLYALRKNERLTTLAPAA